MGADIKKGPRRLRGALGMALTWAVGGLLASLAPFAVVALGLGTPNVPVWQITGALAGPLALGSAVAASGSLLLARMAEEPESLDAAPDAEMELSDEETHELLGDGG